MLDTMILRTSLGSPSSHHMAEVPTPYQLSQFVPPINGMHRDFHCQVTPDNTVLTCHWTPPTDFNPVAAEFRVSSNLRNNVNFFYDFASQKYFFKKKETQFE